MTSSHEEYKLLDEERAVLDDASRYFDKIDEAWRDSPEGIAAMNKLAEQETW